MKGSSFTKAVALFAGAAIVAASAGVASAAPLAKADASCRSTLFKNYSKLNATSLKAWGACIKNGVKAGAGNCHTVVGSDAKVAGAEAKVTAAVSGSKAKCGLADPNALPLARHTICSAPISTPITDWASVGNCLLALNERTVQDLADAILDPDFTTIAGADNPKQLAKCINSIAKNAAKTHSTFGKNQGKAQTTCDGKDTGTCDNATGAYLQGGSDPGGKVGAQIVKFEAAIDKDCGPLSAADQARVRSCANTVAGMKKCLVEKITANAEGLTAAAFDQPGTCPSQVLVTVRGGAVGGSIVRPTELDVGWKGLGHNAQVVDGFDGIVNLSCSDDTCTSCTVTAACDATLGNCRCTSHNETKCSDPFGGSDFAECGVGTCTDPDGSNPMGACNNDGDCGGGQICDNTCSLFFGPPLALSASGTPVCVTNVIPNELDGTADLTTGESTTTVDNIAKVHLGLNQARPCPTCESGTCNGGPRNGMSCHVDAIHPTFGPSSYDCPPDPTDNVSGAGLGITLELTNETTASLPFGTPCTAFGFGAFSCACAVCANDNSVACNSAQDCTDAGVGGACDSQGSGIGSQPNNCSALTCNDQGGGEGLCDAGPDQGYCDAITRASGAGLLTCSSNADCDNYDCGMGPGPGACGGCTLSERLPCYLDPIEATGTPGTEQSVLVSTFCSPPTTSSAVNGSAGSPGAGRAKLDFAFVGLCANGNIWGPGGANCQ